MRNFFYCLIFPHPLNNHRAKLLHHKVLLFAILFFIFSSFFFPSSFNPIGSKLRAYADISVSELLNFTNQKRQENGLPTLSNNSQLSVAAGKKADDMFAKNYWAHNSPDGLTPWVFIKQSGYDYVYAGENLAKGFSSASDVVNAWMASPDHRQNLLSNNFKDVGFAIKSGNLNGEETFLVVQEFGSKSIVPVVKKNTNIEPKAITKVLGFNASSFLANKPSFSLSDNIVLFLVILFVFVLFVDALYIKRNKIIRVVGHNLDHAIYLLAIICIITVLNMGATL